jgi:non-heme chloroperoxidase
MSRHVRARTRDQGRPVRAYPAYLLQADDNPLGVPQDVFDDFRKTITQDRYAWFKFFLDNFYNVDKLAGTRISGEAWNASFQVAAASSAHATLACVETWLTDFRDDLARIDIPLLVVQGTEDRSLAIDATGRRIPELVKDVRLVEVEGGPHNVGWTHPDEVNKAFLDFLAG